MPAHDTSQAYAGDPEQSSQMKKINQKHPYREKMQKTISISRGYDLCKENPSESTKISIKAKK